MKTQFMKIFSWGFWLEINALIIDFGSLMCMVLHNMSFLQLSSKICLISVILCHCQSFWGDFNLIRSNKERNQGSGDPRLMDLFNNFIGQFQYREIFCNGNQFTWSNKQQNPTLIKLDRILMSTSWELFYPTCFAWVKARMDLIIVP